eukprot:CAMPEP_0175150936 /NCGR_PEP_ID=MMETSP0087-20121206/18181_1 /TAXON_ID=136419 /ORGANISM="Unknown Unknown, Strain D1" /LENGTH=574 /DNA_ID=CAMNT_0016437005 /DNA_START=30 /DNA_END=1754 /DNA_ORIENTATION=+
MNSSLECTLCFERFDDEKLCPRLLSCGHSFCSQCLEQLLKQNAITCPTCRKVVSVSEGVHSLPKNFALLDVLDEQDNASQQDDPVRMCEACEDEKHAATSWCVDCKENMCSEAARLHTRVKIARDHRVVSLEELKANPQLAASPIVCSEHNEPFRFFDQDCQRVVCRDCVTLEHNGHKCSSLAEAASKCREEMGALAAKATAHAEEIKAAEARVVGVHRDLDQKHEQEAAKIRTTFNEVRDVIAARERCLLDALGQHHKAKSFSLSNQREHLQTFQACLESAVQRVKTAIQSPGDAQLLVARSDIASTLSAMASQPPVLDPQADDALEFAIDQQKLLDVLSKAGVVIDKSASAATTTAAGSGLEMACPGQEATFTITAHDSEGAPLSRGGHIFVVSLQEEKGTAVHVKLEDKGDGTYVATYTLPAGAKGDCSLSVLLRGSHIQGSPFRVHTGPSFGVGLSGSSYPGYRPVTLEEIHQPRVHNALISCCTRHKGVPLLVGSMVCKDALKVAEGFLRIDDSCVTELGYSGSQTISGVYNAQDHGTKNPWPPQASSFARAIQKGSATSGYPQLFINA